MQGMKRLRKAAKMSQTELAAALGVGQSAVASWEAGLSYPTADKLPKIAETLGCTIDDLFSPAACAAS